MGNCLKTQLKESVNNDNLERLNCIKIKLTPYSGISQLTVGTGDGFTAVIVGTGKFTNSAGTEDRRQETSSINGTFYFKDVVDGDICYIQNKYQIAYFNGDDGKTYLKSGAVLNLDYCSNLLQIKFGNRNNPYFDVNDFSKKTTLNSLSLLRSFYNNTLYGDVETVVKNMVSNGRTTGTFKLGISGNNFKFHEVKSSTVSEWMLIEFISSTEVVVHAGETTSGQTLATYDGTSWTYSS